MYCSKCSCSNDELSQSCHQCGVPLIAPTDRDSVIETCGDQSILQEAYKAVVGPKHQ